MNKKTKQMEFYLEKLRNTLKKFPENDNDN